jgi:hydrogenase-4 component B
MTSLSLVLLAIATLSLSGVPALFGSRRAMAGQRMAVALMLLGSATGLAGAVWALIAPTPVALDLAGVLPMGRFSVALDALGAVFLMPVFVVPALGAVYGLDYWRQPSHPANGRKLSLTYGLLAGAMALVVIARDGVLFLTAWEIMALAAFFASTADDHEPAVRQAGWIYLIATHAGTLCLIALFTLWQRTTGLFAWGPLAPDAAMRPGFATALFLLALIGFGFKAGLMPLHVWLPGAHANAPSHVSAVMSGVMLKMGIYGIVRVAGWLPAPPVWWGGLLLGMGAVTGILGIAFAIAQRDLKRLLAYSSIENIGIIVIGVGLALTGRSLGRPDLVVLGLGGALLHVWNHSLFKGLLFLNAGAIIHATGTRDIERLGGLAKRMPRTAGLFLLGATAICALPPLNGFVSEWLIYVGLFRTTAPAAGGPAWPMAGLGVVALAMIGALAAGCFCRAFGVVFLGAARSDATEHAHDPGLRLLGPMAALAAGCLMIGFLPVWIAPALEHAAGVWAGAPGRATQSLADLAPLGWIGLLAVALAGLALATGLLLRLLWRRYPCASAETWGCGYARPTARIQYTGSSFGQTLVSLFAWALWPITRAPRIVAPFPRSRGFSSTVPDTVLDRLALPVFNLAARGLLWLRFVQQGRIQVYVAYFLAALLTLLLLGRWGNHV